MSNDLLHILSDENPEIDNKKILDYLNDQLSPEEKHEFEAQLINSDLLNDAMEGLGKFKNKQDLNALVLQLNQQLKKQIGKKKTLQNKRKIKDIPWLYFSIIMILLVILISFLTIWKHLN